MPDTTRVDADSDVVSGFSRTFERAPCVEVLEATTVDDARDVYAAIRRRRRAGSDRSEAQDVADEPTMTLLDAMRLAADRDGIAREYATAFEITFETGAPALDAGARRRALLGRRDRRDVSDAARRRTRTPTSRAAAARRSRRTSREHARSALAAGGVRSAAGRRAIDEMDRRMRDARNTANPGTTADLTAAAIFVVLLGGGWKAHDDR